MRKNGLDEGRSKGTPIKEIETTLIVSSNEPDEIVRRIGKLDSISGYALVPQKTQRIIDTYFDKPDQALESRMLGFRIREVDGNLLITLKGPSELNQAGVSERFELELKWSKDGLRRITDELSRWGIATEGLHKDSDFERPLQVLSALGLQVIQRREDSREVRNVVPIGDVSDVLAELVIDSLTLNFKGQQVHHKEVEIEAKSEEGASVLGSLTEGLKNLFPSDLIAWSHSKLATGLALKGMADSGDLKDLLDEHGNIKPEAYDRIDSYLQSHGPHGPHGPIT